MEDIDDFFYKCYRARRKKPVKKKKEHCDCCDVNQCLECCNKCLIFNRYVNGENKSLWTSLVHMYSVYRTLGVKWM